MPPTSTPTLQTTRTPQTSALIRLEPKTSIPTNIVPSPSTYHSRTPPVSTAVPPVQRQPVQDRVPIQNRVRVLLVHIPKLSIRGQARLASEVGVSRSTISRLVSGKINPSYRLARGVTTALERLLGYPLDMRDVFSTDGTYLTPSGCALCKCTGCFPDQYYDNDDNLRPEWRGEKPGDWSLTPLPQARPVPTNT